MEDGALKANRSTQYQNEKNPVPDAGWNFAKTTCPSAKQRMRNAETGPQSATLPECANATKGVTSGEEGI